MDHLQLIQFWYIYVLVEQLEGQLQNQQETQLQHTYKQIKHNKKRSQTNNKMQLV